MPEMSSVSPWSFSGRFSWMGGEEGIARTKFGQHGGGCESGTCLDSRRCRVRHVDRGAGLLLTRSPKRLQHRTTSHTAPLIDFFPANEHHSIKDRGRADRDQADTFLFYPSLRLGVSGSFFCSQQCFASNCELASLPTRLTARESNPSLACLDPKHHKKMHVPAPRPGYFFPEGSESRICLEALSKEPLPAEPQLSRCSQPKTDSTAASSTPASSDRSCPLSRSRNAKCPRTSRNRITPPKVRRSSLSLRDGAESGAVESLARRKKSAGRSPTDSET